MSSFTDLWINVPAKLLFESDPTVQMRISVDLTMKRNLCKT